MKITHVEDYIDAVAKTYSYIPKELIQRIVEYGFRMFHILTKRGINIRLSSGGYSITSRDAYKENTCDLYKKMIAKNRMLYRFKLEDFDGYYYFGLTKDMWEKYRYKRNGHYNITNVILHKIKDEVLSYGRYDYFCRVKWPVDMGWVFDLPKLRTKTIECIAKRNSDGNIILLENEQARNKTSGK